MGIAGFVDTWSQTIQTGRPCFCRYSFAYKIRLLNDITQILLFVNTILRIRFSGAILAMILNYVLYFATSVLILISRKSTKESK